jgi:hypothetical protein
MSKKLTRLSDQVRRAVNDSGVSRYRLCKDTGIDQGAFSHFMAGKIGLGMANLDALGEVLRLRVTAEGPARVSPPMKAGRKPKAKGR